MTLIVKAASPRPDGNIHQDNGGTVILFVQPGKAQLFEFFHPTCFQQRHAGEPLMRFTTTQARDAISFHHLSPICPGCGASVL